MVAVLVKVGTRLHTEAIFLVLLLSLHSNGIKDVFKPVQGWWESFILLSPLPPGGRSGREERMAGCCGFRWADARVGRHVTRGCLYIRLSADFYSFAICKNPPPEHLSPQMSPPEKFQFIFFLLLLTCPVMIDYEASGKWN